MADPVTWFTQAELYWIGQYPDDSYSRQMQIAYREAKPTEPNSLERNFLKEALSEWRFDPNHCHVKPIQKELTLEDLDHHTP